MPTMKSSIPEKVVWRPQQGPQEAYVNCPYPLVGFGGARGGGKSNGILGKWAIKAESYGPAFNGVFFRKSLPQTDDLIEDAKSIYLKLGARWYEQKKMFKFEGGGRIRFRDLENDVDAEKYQGQNLTDCAVEEAGNYSDPSCIWKLFGALRSKTGVPTQLTLTWNPGGPGHWWIKEKFWDPAPGGMKKLYFDLPTGKRIPYIYIPSRVQDNKILLENDPDYIDRLHLVGNKELVRAWLEGDMEIHVGAYFDCFSAKHLIDPFPIPKHWPKYVGYDWGFKSPSCCVWGAVSSGKLDNGSECDIPKGAMVIYREYKVTETTNLDQARRIKELTGDEEPIMVADPSIFKTDGGMSIADQFRQESVIFRPADNHRISGWNEIRKRLSSEPPMLYFFNTLDYLRHSLPALPMCPRNNEDVDTTADDHGADALRYLCKQRALPSDYQETIKPDRMGAVKIARYIQEKRSASNKPQV